MSAPVYSDSTEDLYLELPLIQRTQDEPLYELKRWLSGAGDQLGAVRVILERLAYYTEDQFPEPSEETSDLADPMTADAAWLPWLGQLVGVRLDPNDDEAAQRNQVGSAASGFRVGTHAALLGAISALLTGTKYLRVDSHSIENLGDGGEWDVRMVTRESETPAGVDFVAAATRANAKPAGVILHHRSYGASWDVIELNRPQWTDWGGSTWNQIEETGLL